MTPSIKYSLAPWIIFTLILTAGCGQPPGNNPQPSENGKNPSPAAVASCQKEKVGASMEEVSSTYNQLKQDYTVRKPQADRKTMAFDLGVAMGARFPDLNLNGFMDCCSTQTYSSWEVCKDLR